MVSSLDDARAALRAGGARPADPHRRACTSRRRRQLAALARDAEISTLALLEPTDSERAERGRAGSA